MAEDDAWLEAELEQQLLEASDADEHDNDDFDIEGDYLQAARDRIAKLHSKAADTAEGDQAQGVGQASESFQELIASLQAWERTTVQQASSELQEALEVAEFLEQQFQHLPDALQVQAEGEIASQDEFAQLVLQARKEAIEVITKKTTQEAGGRDLPTTNSLIGHQEQLLGAAAPNPGSEDDTTLQPEILESAGLAADDSSLELLERQIEDERQRRLEELEAQQQVLILQLQREEEVRRMEQERIREEVAMHSEELHLREFYQHERSLRRMELRAMLSEDTYSRHVREEEHIALQNAERGREATERNQMSRDDEFSKAVRRKENELREGNAFSAEDLRSKCWNEFIRQYWEAACLAATDAESALWRDAVKQEAELLRMAAEDAHADLIRQCTVPKSKPTAGAASALLASKLRLTAKNIPVRATPPESFGLPDGTSPLAGKVKDCLGRRQRHYAAEMGPIQDQVVKSDVPSSSSTSCALPSLLMLDPWAELKGEEAGKVQDTLNPGSQLSDSNKLAADSTCGSVVCTTLRAALLRMKGHSIRRHRQNDLLDKTNPNKVQQQRHKTPDVESVLSPADGLEEFVGSQNVAELARLEIRMEGLEELPALSNALNLKILILSGNRLKGGLDMLRHCSLLEDLGLCQNMLTSLSGLRFLPRLAVLKATMNEIFDAEDLAHVPALMVCDLSKNRLSSVPVRCKRLTKLVLYRNSLDSTLFLEHLPSLTELDLGRNKLTELDSSISAWNPLLMKLFLYENKMVNLPEMWLPLLTDLWVDNNLLEVLGPLGFLPSLERLQVKNNRIRLLGSPMISASPLLHTLELAFNQLPQTELSKAVLHFPRLRRLQLNDNPAGSELLHEYRHFVLRMGPQLEELDNETVSEAERTTAWVAKTVNDPYFPLHLRSKVCAAVQTLPRMVSDHKPLIPSKAIGLLGLAAPHRRLRGYREEHPDLEILAAAGQSTPACRSSTSYSFTSEEAMNIQRANTLQRWTASWTSPQQVASGCEQCSIAAFCEALSGARSACLVTQTREERRQVSAALYSYSSHFNEVSFVLQRRIDFWLSFLDLCHQHYDTLVCAKLGSGLICRNALYELPLFRFERVRHQQAFRIQARWRGILARRIFSKLRFQRYCQVLPQRQQDQVTRVQALWRGSCTRCQLRASGLVLPADRRNKQRQQAASKLQAVIRGSRVRSKLRWAREMSKLANDDLEDCPEVDLGDILGDAHLLAMDDPFTQLRLPTVPALSTLISTQDRAKSQQVSSRQMQLSSKAQVVASDARNSVVPSGLPPVQIVSGHTPLMAWGTPPPSAGPCGESSLTSGLTGLIGSPTSTRPDSACSGMIPRRSRSMSSTAESAVPEHDCPTRGHNRVEQAQQEWGFQDAETAKAYLAAQRHRRPKPPAMPVQSGSGSGRGLGAARRVVTGSNSSKSLEPISRQKLRSPGGASCVKAQDAIAEFRRLQEEADRTANSAGPALEFRSGEPNLKLMRSSKGLHGLNLTAESSPRVPSPLHGFR